MSRLRLSLYLALALVGLALAGSSVQAEPCTVGLGVHNHAWIVLKGQKLAQCTSTAGCKCVSCWNILGGAAGSTCYPLFVSMPK
jgi:hypothetical protein